MVRDKVEYEELLSRDSLDAEDVQLEPALGSARTVSARKSRWWFYLTAGTSDIDRATSSSHDRVPQLLSWLAAAVVIVAVSDLLALAYIARMFDTVFQDKNFAANLEYANPYIGLKELYESGQVNSSKIDPILIRPRVSAQVFVDEPDRLAPRGEHDYWSPAWGTLSPNERHLYVTPKIHTIVQYRAIDFGMEDCHLVFTLPKLGVPLEDHASFSMHPSSRFDVFRLSAERPIDVKTLSYRTKPKVAERVATVEARVDGETRTHRFPCPWSSLHVFEVTCAENSECLLDVWSSQNTTYGINVYQHQTV